MNKIIAVKFDPVKCCVRFEFLGDIVAEIQQVKIIRSNENSYFVPVYEICWHDINSILIMPGKYHITDIAMPALIYSMTQCIIDDYHFKNSIEEPLLEEIESQYYYSDGTISQSPVFVSDFTSEEEINELPKQQMGLSEIWSYYREDRGGILDEDFIIDLIESRLLEDFLCLINIHLSFNISGGQKDE